jgi:hypothetical protein
MLNFGKKNSSFARQKKNSNSCVVRKKILNETKNHNSPLQPSSDWVKPKTIKVVFIARIIKEKEHRLVLAQNQDNVSEGPMIYRTRGEYANHYTTVEPMIYRTLGEYPNHYGH